MPHEPLTVDQLIAKRGMVRKGMFLTSDPYLGPPRPQQLRAAPTIEELTERLAAVRKKIEDLKAGKL